MSLQNGQKQFTEKIQNWVTLDNQQRILLSKLKEIREKKSEINDDILDYARDNSLMKNTIQISDGTLKFKDTTYYPPISLKFVEKSLGEIIHNEMQVKQIMQYLKQNREIKTIPEIKRFS